jgi:hypothetical protein
MAKKHDWIPEEEAAEMTRYRPRTLRRYAKLGVLPINFTARNQRRYQYSRQDIEKYLMDHSTILA